jgi:hypothetical protein
MAALLMAGLAVTVGRAGTGPDHPPIDWAKLPFSSIVKQCPAMAGLEGIRDRPMHSFIYGLYGRGYCLAHHDDISELKVFSPNGLSIQLTWPAYAEGSRYLSGGIGPEPGKWMISGAPASHESRSHFSLKPYDKLCDEEIQAALDRLWSDRRCDSSGLGRAYWYFANVGGTVTESADVTDRAGAYAVLKALLVQWDPWYFNSPEYSGFFLPADQVGVRQ